jgi:hypothetical protein
MKMSGELVEAGIQYLPAFDKLRLTGRKNK